MVGGCGQCGGIRAFEGLPITSLSHEGNTTFQLKAHLGKRKNIAIEVPIQRDYLHRNKGKEGEQDAGAEEDNEFGEARCPPLQPHLHHTSRAEG